MAMKSRSPSRFSSLEEYEKIQVPRREVLVNGHQDYSDGYLMTLYPDCRTTMRDLREAIAIESARMQVPKRVGRAARRSAFKLLEREVRRSMNKQYGPRKYIDLTQDPVAMQDLRLQIDDIFSS